MSLIQIKCAYCDTLVLKEAGGVNRSRRIGAPVFCDRLCSGLWHRSGKSDEQRRAEKAAGHKGDGPVFDLATEAGTKSAAQFRFALMKLRAKLGRQKTTRGGKHD